VLRFYFDYVSPNAWLAWTQLPALAARHGVALDPLPVLFAGLLEAHGQLGPAEVAPKMRWMARNNARKAALLDVPLEPPLHHPFNPLVALRASSVVEPPAARAALVDALFRAVWVRRLHVADPAVVERVATECGLDGAAVVAAAGRPEAKARLRRQTDDAIAAGVFGVPTMVVGDELFWGFDDLPHLDRFLAGDDPLDATMRAKWASAPTPSAVRDRRRPSGR